MISSVLQDYFDDLEEINEDCPQCPQKLYRGFIFKNEPDDAYSFVICPACGFYDLD